MSHNIITMNKELTLYYFDSCPFCIKVIQFLDKHQIQLKMKNTIRDATAKSELLEIGGKTQVPCLVINGKAMYESDDIIQWLKNHFNLSFL